MIQLPIKCCDLFVGGLCRNVQSFILCRVRTNAEFMPIPAKIVGYKAVKNRCRYYGRWEDVVPTMGLGISKDFQEDSVNKGKSLGRVVVMGDYDSFTMWNWLLFDVKFIGVM